VPARAVVIDLDRQLGRRQPERGQQRVGLPECAPRRERLRHLAERHPLAVTRQRHRHDAGRAADTDRLRTGALADDERRAEQRMAGERQLDGRGEDPRVHIGLLVAGEQEHRLGQVQLARDALHGARVQAGPVEEHRDRVALQRGVGEHVGDHIVAHDLTPPAPSPAADPPSSSCATSR
jgi:hypothetical protein